MANDFKTQFMVTKMLIELDTPDLNYGEKWVLVALSSFGLSNGKQIFPSLETIAKITRMSKRSVQNHLKGLDEKGYLTIKSGGLGRSNRYEINLRKLAKAKKLMEFDEQQSIPEMSGINLTYALEETKFHKYCKYKVWWTSADAAAYCKVNNIHRVWDGTNPLRMSA